MQIEPSDPRSHVETITYTRSIVPGSVADIRLSFRSLSIRPDELEFTLRHPKDEPWFVDRVILRGHQVLNGGKTGTPRHAGERGHEWSVDSPHSWRAFPADVVEYVEIMLAGKQQGMSIQ